MSDKKKSEAKKSEPTKKVEPTDKYITLADGRKVFASGAFIANGDGTYTEAEMTDLLKHSHVAMTIMSKNAETGESKSETFDVLWGKEDDGHYFFSLATADGLNDDIIKSKPDDKYHYDMTLIGRGDVMRATYAISQVWRAFSQQFGIETAFRCIKVKLHFKTKQWYGVFVPVTDLLG